MPVILDPADFSLWLGSTVATGPLTALLRPFSAEQMESHRVSARVNDVRIDDAECVVARLPRERQGELF
jgi:putative SOS response-associated peptidase YedK